MILSLLGYKRGHDSYPRVSGGDPEMVTVEGTEMQLSPRERG